MAIRLHLDEHIDPAVAEGLRQRGIDVAMAVDVYLESASDAEYLQFTREEGRVLVTNDQNFLLLHRQGKKHAGIVCWACGTRSIREAIRRLTLLADCLSEKEMEGKVEFL